MIQFIKNLFKEDNAVVIEKIKFHYQLKYAGTNLIQPIFMNPHNGVYERILCVDYEVSKSKRLNKKFQGTKNLIKNAKYIDSKFIDFLDSFKCIEDVNNYNENVLKSVSDYNLNLKEQERIAYSRDAFHSVNNIKIILEEEKKVEKINNKVNEINKKQLNK